MSTPFIPRAQLQRVITYQLLQNLKRGPGAPPIDTTALQLYQLTHKANFLDLPDLTIPDNF